MPGAGKQAQDVQDQIRQLFEQGLDPNTIHKRLGVGRSSVYRMRRSIAQHGTPYAPPELARKNGRPKTLTKQQELAVCEWLRDTQNREGYLDHMVLHIYNTYGVMISTTTCSKMKRKWVQVLEAQERGEVAPDPETIKVVVPRGPNKKPRKRKTKSPETGVTDEQAEDLSYPPPVSEQQPPVQQPFPTNHPIVDQALWTKQMLQQSGIPIGEQQFLPESAGPGAVNLGH